MSAPAKILELMKRFEDNADDYHAAEYNEASLRQQFVNPFFKSLGWDMENEEGAAETYKDVIHEAAETSKAFDSCLLPRKAERCLAIQAPPQQNNAPEYFIRGLQSVPTWRLLDPAPLQIGMLQNAWSMPSARSCVQKRSG